MSSLSEKRLHELRGIASSMGIDGVFQKDENQLRQDIQLLQQEIYEPKVEAPVVAFLPVRQSGFVGPEVMLKALEPYIAKGLRVQFAEDNWTMDYGKRSDTGTMRMPLRHVLKAAEMVLTGKR